MKEKKKKIKKKKEADDGYWELWEQRRRYIRASRRGMR